VVGHQQHERSSRWPLVNAGHVLSSAELYDPISGTWTATGAMIGVRYLHAATLLLDGTVLVAGGNRSICDYNQLATAELYDSGSGNR
jgi:hypothetical protein